MAPARPPKIATPGSIEMANTKSAQKMVRKIARRTAVNKARVSRMRTFVKKVEMAIAAGDKAAAQAAFKDAEPQLMKAAQSGVMRKNTASRKVSRLSAAVKAL
jgi:small subunit ribosomal protein S20